MVGIIQSQLPLMIYASQEFYLFFLDLYHHIIYNGGALGDQSGSFKHSLTTKEATLNCKLMVLDRQVVTHRDGSTTTWLKQSMSLDEVVRWFAIYCKMITPNQRADDFLRTLSMEQHGSRTYCYLTITDPRTARSESATKSKLGTYFGVNLVTLTKDGAVFWEDISKPPNRWVMDDGFVV